MGRGKQEEINNMKERLRLYNAIKYVLMAAVVTWLVHFLFFTRMGSRLLHTNVEELSEGLRSFGVFAVFLGMAAVILQSIVPFVPFVLVAGANVLVFGLAGGFLINYVMSVVGAYLAFIIGRHFGNDWVQNKLSKFAVVQQFSRKMEQQGFFYVLIGRLIPVLPSTAVSLAAGASNVKIRHFIAATIIGKLPIVLLESFIGHDLLHFHSYRKRLFILVLIFVLLMVIGSWLKSKLTQKPKKMGSDS